MISRLRSLLNRSQGRPVRSNLSFYRRILTRISSRESSLKLLDDSVLKAFGQDLITSAGAGRSIDETLVDVFTLVRVVSDRVLGMRPFDVQMMAGIALDEGKIVEMQTGEGKTLAAVAPAALNAITSRSTHVLTFNDYLARRDADWMKPVYEFLGLSVGFVQEGMSLKERQRAYGADITYATAREAGFDFLRDQLRYESEDVVHRPFDFIIVDEVDSLLIDEARIPLVISGSTAEPEVNPYKLTRIAGELQQGVEFDTDEYERNIFLTDQGLVRVEGILQCGSLYHSRNARLLTALNLALHAEALLRKDIDYIVRDGKIELVDEFTGRVAEKRRWPDGLQSALEAKEGLALQKEGIKLGAITLQHYMGLYTKVSGMTGTAAPAAEEFRQFYNLDTVVFPTNRPCIRIDESDTIFTHREAKEKALVDEIRKNNETGRPILVGTTSVQESEQLSRLLKQSGILCNVLNAKNNEREAQIIARAGSPGAVTISTNMAGRGTDIILGPDSEADRQKVLNLGGLYVIGTNRHESRRIDDQLRGRCGRQGDPGSSRFFISLEDDLIVRFGIHEPLPRKFKDFRQEQSIDMPVFAERIAFAQRIIEGQNLEIRKTLWNYSSLLEQQRRIIRRMRDEVLKVTWSSDLLERESPDRRQELLAEVGQELLQRVEQQILLYHIDKHWGNHLAVVDDIREGIHLVGAAGRVPVFGGINPFDYFNRKVHEVFNQMMMRMEKEVVDTFNRIQITPNGIDLDKEGLRGPSSIWTYLINDNPSGSVPEKLFNNVRRMLGS